MQHVLIVEDDADLRELLRDVLSAQGYAVDTAGNGEDAIAKLQERARPDLIVLDLVMPVMNGAQFRGLQLADPGLASIPLIVMSAASEARTEATWLRTVPFLQKPVDLAKLISATRGVLFQQAKNAAVREDGPITARSEQMTP
jgi:CheY-like chemotaxis protein